MKFAMYVINCETKEVFGSNDSEAIAKYIENHEDTSPDEFLILHGTYGNIQMIGEGVVEIEELSDVEEEDSENNYD